MENEQDLKKHEEDQEQSNRSSTRKNTMDSTRDSIGSDLLSRPFNLEKKHPEPFGKPPMVFYILESF